MAKDVDIAEREEAKRCPLDERRGMPGIVVGLAFGPFARKLRAHAERIAPIQVAARVGANDDVAKCPSWRASVAGRARQGSRGEVAE